MPIVQTQFSGLTPTRRATMPRNEIRWAAQDLGSLEDLYWDHIAPGLRAEDIDVHKPHATILTQRYPGLDYALREKHDLTVGEFLKTVVGLEEEPPEDPIPEKVRTALENYLDRPKLTHRRSDATVETIRSRLERYLRTYVDVNDDNILDNLSDPSAEGGEQDRVMAVFYRLEDELGSDRTKRKYLSRVQQFYSWLERRGKAEFDPTTAVLDEFGWESSPSDPIPLQPDQVAGLYGAASTSSERVMVAALAAWGLRTGEVARLKSNQIILDEDPRIEFESRKNGPGSVSLIYGLDPLADRLDQLVENGDKDWNGFLFPSSSSSSGHVSPDTIRNRFTRLANAADVDMDGETPTPKMARRYWYEAYTSAQGRLLEIVDEFKEDQGSTSTDVITSHYLSEERKRKLRRQAMRSELKAAFERG
ncbi:tyrosine-type recombinase/integrase [Halodesulfurarchaeum sp. HSR-GB]|uniref:tyrosine-type recombinase/integrase n=1 Tax=Halodesulfurarchaeum sp. HSR-GB TaxID=3074077 RepID=UPI00285E81DF|nr:tyrosine-type recombinase/integrase [Halodesulfurarchaeum sp. HSR-GB]MDR5657748.1 tyrosine-type recombinase/integrase [Halodesulfurarchaeum sp. HSR-GB]